jgi:8-oxo-dGTP diphosphatase
MRSPNRVIGITIRDNKILLIHRFRDGNEYWVFPTGEVQGIEDPDAAIQRVMLEQTRLGLVTKKLLFEEFDEHAFTWFYFICELTYGEPILGGPEAETQSPTNQYVFEWVDLEQITSLNLYPLPEKLIEFTRNKAPSPPSSPPTEQSEVKPNSNDSTLPYGMIIPSSSPLAPDTR